MKINQFNLIGLVFLLAASQLTAQTNTQMPKWPFNGKEVDFTTQQVNNMSSSLATPQFVSNGYYDVNDDLLFHIIDNNMWWGNGNFAGTLFTDTEPIDHPDQMFPEVLVVPKTQAICSDASYYVFYAVRKYSDGTKSQDPHIGISIMGNEITPPSSNNNIIQESLGEGIAYTGSVGIAATDFLGTTDNRRLYYVWYSDDEEESKIEFFDVTPNGISGPNTVCTFTNNSKYFEPSEVEISPDNSMLVFTRPKYLANVNDDNSNDLTIVHLNPSTGYLNTSQGVNGFTYVDLGPSNSIFDKYMGVEFSANAEYIYVTRHGTGLYEYELSTGISTQIGNTSLIANSQLELGRDDKIYGVADNGQLYEINDLGVYGQSNDYNITSSGVITSEIFTSSYPVRTIPDQIDGCAYDDLFGTIEECCYVDLYTPANSTMTGVQVQTSGTDTDIIIQSGNSVTWTATSNSFGNVAEVFMEKGDIIIQPGASLTIEDMIIHFQEGYEIQMDDNPSGVGSRLTLDNTTLTVFDECEGDKFWAGIDLSGGWDGQLQIPFSSCKQPYLKMLNNSKIEFAVRGVDAAAGGLVRAYDSDFINNIVSVTITGYTDQHSHFQNCDFIWDDEIYAKNENPSIHLHMWTASGVGVKGCRFKNEASLSESYPNRGVGIIADYTDFDLDGLCLDSPSQLPCINYQNNLFSRLYFGIKSNSGDNILVDRCDFTDNQRGAWIVSSSALQFTRNDLDVFDTQGGSFQINNSFGLYLESCTGYQVEENTFRDGRLGMVINSSGADENEIYYNDFYNLSGGTSPSVSAVTMGKNAETHTGNRYTGLQYKCNDFDQTDYAITLTGGIINTQSGGQLITTAVMRYIQGQDISTMQVVPANNTFWLHGESMSVEADFYIDNTYADFLYKYAGSSDNTLQFDAKLNSYDNVNIGQGIVDAFFIRTLECPSNLSSGGGVITPIRNSLDGKEAEQDSLESEYNALIADVNELELIIAAQTASGVNQQAVHNSLMEASPNLTDTVLSTYLLNDNANELSRTSVMIANSPLPGSVKEDVEISNLSPELKNHISQYQTGINHLEDLENRILKTKASRQYLTDRLQLQYVHNESKETQLDWINYLENKTDLHSKLKLADMYIKQNQMSEAETLLANIETMLTGTENTEKLKQVKVKQIELALRQDMSCQELPSGDLAYLYDLAEDYNHKSGGDARAILMASGIESFEPIVILPNPNQAKSAIADNSHENVERPSTTPKLQSRFEIFPNPVDDKLSVEFISMGETCDFVVYDMQGKIVKQLTRNEGLGYFVLDVTDLQSGNYILYSPQLSGKKQFVVKR